ncbi:hypothetical protein CDV36_002317 [Fusarium kuroshium]|uniref:Uncharacterized protein n=1 Tax=Fusarium kuroshium TaxID=2010991 RepID=A0A3M2SK92_9HYPO|nr:hypothetical protein CDV36_002317 [Fusarium kuroshium]
MSDIVNPSEIAPFQLYLVASDADYHTLQEGDELNRSNVTDDTTDGFTIMASLEKAIHGEGKNLYSFIGFHFIFRGANEKRRFKRVTITIRFEDSAKPLQDDPEVEEIWPGTEYVWQGLTKEVQDTKSLTGTAKGGPSGGQAAIEGKWQREEKFVRNTPARLSGEKTLLKRKAGSHKNAIRIRMSENMQEESGLLRELRTGILVKRKRAGPHRFKAHFEIDAEADMRYDIVQGLKTLVGAQHITDPVVFEPGVNFFGTNDLAGINSREPDVEMVQAYGEAVSWTELANVSRKVMKDNGKWKEIVEGE